MQLTVTDERGFSASTSVVIDIGAPPIPVIESPPNGTTFAVGDLFTLIGSAMDSDGKAIPDSSLLWEIRQHHNTHYHPFLDPTNGNYIPMDAAPAPEDFLAATNSHLEILLTATDSHGFSATTNRLLMPQMVEVSLETEPPGMILLVDGYAVTTPVSVASWVNNLLEVIANDQEGLVFHGWSDAPESEGSFREILVGSASGQEYMAYFGTPYPTSAPIVPTSHPTLAPIAPTSTPPPVTTTLAPTSTMSSSAPLALSESLSIIASVAFFFIMLSSTV